MAYAKGSATRLGEELAAVDLPTLIVIHQPLFKAAIWPMDRVGLKLAGLFGVVVPSYS
jgi:hypothetical protein